MLSHAAGVGEPAPPPIVRLMMALKLASLAQGASGVRLETLDLLEGDAHLGRDPGRAVAGLRRRLRRPRAARAHDGGHDRRRRCHFRRRSRARRRGARRCRARADRARPEGGAGASERHAVLDGLCARRLLRGGARLPLGARHRRALDRRRARLRRAVRSAHPSPAAAPGADRGGRRASRTDAGERHSRIAPRRRRARAGPLLHPLPAAGDGRGARHAARARRRCLRPRRTASPTIR